MALVKLYASLRSVTGLKEVRLSGSSLPAILQELVQAHPQLEKYLLEAGQVRPRVIISLNGQTLSQESFQETSIKDEDVIAIFPPVAGG